MTRSIGSAVRLAEIEQAPRRGMREDLLFRIPLEGQRHAIGFVSAGPELRHEAADVDFGAPVHERHLHLAHDNRANHDLRALS